MAFSEFNCKSLSSELSLELNFRLYFTKITTVDISQNNLKLTLMEKQGRRKCSKKLKTLSKKVTLSPKSLLSTSSTSLSFRAQWKDQSCPSSSCLESETKAVERGHTFQMRATHIPGSKLCLLCNLLDKRKRFVFPTQKNLCNQPHIYRLETWLLSKSLSTCLKESQGYKVDDNDSEEKLKLQSQPTEDHNVKGEIYAEAQPQTPTGEGQDDRTDSSWTNTEPGCTEECRTSEMNPESDEMVTGPTEHQPTSDEGSAEQPSIESAQQFTESECPPTSESTLPNNDKHLLNTEYVFDPFHAVVFGHQPQKFNSTMQVLYGLFKRCASYDAILTTICGASEHHFLPLLHPPFSLELHNLLGMFTSTTAHQRKSCLTLFVEFAKSIESCLSRAVTPYTDARSVTIVPFVREQMVYLQEKAFSCFQVQLPRAFSEDEAVVFVLLASKVLSECTAESGLLKALECDDQCFVFHSFASYLATKNHMLEALVKLFPEHATGFIVLASPAEKYNKDLVDSFLNNLPRRFQSKFISHSYKMIEIFRQVLPENMSTSEQLSGHMQALATSLAVDMHSDSGLLSIPHSYVEGTTVNVQEESGIGESNNLTLFVHVNFLFCALQCAYPPCMCND